MIKKTFMKILNNKTAFKAVTVFNGLSTLNQLGILFFSTAATPATAFLAGFFLVATLTGVLVIKTEQNQESKANDNKNV